MFESSFVTISDLPWESVAQGKEPEAILMCRINIHGVAYAMHAFRVAMPFSSGWTSRMSWEDDKHALGSGILWHSEATREYVKATDAGLPSIGLNPLLEEDEREWNIKWLMLSRMLGKRNQNWMPSQIMHHFYYIIGVPVGNADVMRDTVINFSMGDRRNNLTENVGVTRIGLCLEKGAYDFILSKVRNIESHIRPFNDDAAHEIKAGEAIINLLDGKLMPMDMVDGWWTGIIVPAHVDEWIIDTASMTKELSKNLEKGRVKWLLQRYDRRFDAFDARILENLAARCRSRKLALSGSDMWLVMSMDSLLDEVGFGRDEEDVKSRLFKLLSRTVIRGIGLNDSGYYERRTSIAERIYIFEDAVSIQICNDFAWLSESLNSGSMNRLAWYTDILETPSQANPGDLPDWGSKLPQLLDVRVRNLLNEWDGKYSP